MNELDQAPAMSIAPSPRRAGRPRKEEGPRVNYAELDEVLVFGEPDVAEGGAILYPSYRELAARYGVANSVIAEYARKNRCLKRRKLAAAKIRARADEKQIELRATTLAGRQLEAAPSAAQILQEAHHDVLADAAGASPSDAR